MVFVLIVIIKNSHAVRLTTLIGAIQKSAHLVGSLTGQRDWAQGVR